MNVLVTGGSGRVGRAAVAQLVTEGHEVTVIGRSAGVALPGARYEQCDISDYDSLARLMHNCDAVVHLAAIPDPVGNPGRRLFEANDLGTFNVFESAAEADVDRVVAASSINAIGYFFGERTFPLPYLPVDEQTPGLPTDAYSFSKEIMERIARYFDARDGIRSILLRLPAVFPHERTLEAQARGPRRLPIIEQLLALDDGAREDRLRAMHEGYDRHRRARRLDTLDRSQRPGDRSARFRSDYLEPDELELMHGKANYFAYIDELDSAAAIASALTADYEGSHAFFVNAATNSTGLPVADLAQLFWPPIPEIRPQTPGDTCLCSIDTARTLIGFAPTWNI